MVQPRSRSRRCRALVSLLAAGLALTTLSCSDDGKTLRAPPPGATAPLRPTSTTSSGITPSTATLVPGLLSLSSTDFEPGSPLADDVTCLGQGRSPALAWTGLPEGTVEVAVVITDPADDLFTNWVVAGLDPAGAVTAGAVPDGAIVANNSDGQPAYAPPCPPEGESHIIEFTLYALTGPSGVTPEMTAEQAVATLDGGSSTRAVVTATATGP